MAAWCKSFAKRLECEGGRDDATGELRFTNDDLKPVEASRRRWRHISFVDFWIADAFNVNTFLIAAVSLDIGLSWWQAWLCVWFGYTVAGTLVTMNGRIGAVYHIGFPVANRSSFGIWGSMWPVFNRGVIACFWYGVQCWIGGQCVYLMITSIWPSFSQRPSLTKEIALGGKVNLFISFLIFWLGSLPFLWFPVHQIRHLFTVKAIVAPLGGVSLLIWVVARAASIGPVFDQKSKVHGSDLAWAMVSAIMATLANMSTVIINNSDLSRFATSTSSAKWPQLLAIPVSFGLTSFIGIIVSSASTVIFPGSTTVWNPLDVLSRFLGADENGEPANSAERAGVFFIAVAFTVAQLGVNIAANTISAGMDFTALLPRYINIRRGGYLCAIIGLVICPWQFLTSASKFTTYLSAYTIFLSSIVGTMLADYYLVRRGYIEVEQLYNTENTGLYFGVCGLQLRGYAAYIAGISVNIVGFVGKTGVTVPKGATYIYRLSFLPGFIVSAAVYYLLSQLFAMPERPVHGWCELGDTLGRSRSVPDNEARPGEQEASGELRRLSTVTKVLIGRNQSLGDPLQALEEETPWAKAPG